MKRSASQLKDMKKINLGSSDTRVKGWLNYDILPGDAVDIVGDVKYLYMLDKPDAIRASHILEHILPSEVPYVLRTWYETLKEEGILIIGVPDFDYIIQKYIRNPKLYLDFWRKNFNSMLLKNLYGSFYAHRAERGNQPFRHHVVFNEASLRELLEDSGFIDIKRLSISNIEENDGFNDSMIRPWSLNMSCRKPKRVIELGHWNR